MTDWQMGIQAFREGRVREAADRLRSAADDSEMSVSQAARFDTCAYLGAALYALGRPAEAARAFEAAFRLSPTPTPPDDLILNLSHAYLAAGRREAAREALLFLLHQSPGHVAARMLLQRLDNAPAGEPLSGSIMGESPQSVKRYIETLTFDTAISEGYDHAQVREALSQLSGYIDVLNENLEESRRTIGEQEAEIQRYRQMEDAMVQNIVQLQQTQTQQNQAQQNAPLAEVSDAPALSPIEILFQKNK